MINIHQNSIYIYIYDMKFIEYGAYKNYVTLSKYIANEAD